MSEADSSTSVPYSLGPWVRPFIHRPQPLTGHVSVDLCSSHIGVSEQLLNSSEICSSIEEVGGIRMTQSVRMEDLSVTQRIPCEDSTYVSRRHPLAPRVHKESLPHHGWCCQVFPCSPEVVLERLSGRIAEREAP